MGGCGLLWLVKLVTLQVVTGDYEWSWVVSGDKECLQEVRSG